MLHQQLRNNNNDYTVLKPIDVTQMCANKIGLVANRLAVCHKRFDKHRSYKNGN